jgi:hypothetical protein
LLKDFTAPPTSKITPPRPLAALKRETQYRSELLNVVDELASYDQFGNRRLQIVLKTDKKLTNREFKLMLLNTLKKYQSEYQVIWATVTVPGEMIQGNILTEWFNPQVPVYQRRSFLKEDEKFKGISLDYPM